MRHDTVFLKRFCKDGRILEDELYVKNMRDFSCVMSYVRDIVKRGLAHFEIKFVCYSKGFTLLGAL